MDQATIVQLNADGTATVVFNFADGTEDVKTVLLPDDSLESVTHALANAAVDSQIIILQSKRDNPPSFVNFALLINKPINITALVQASNQTTEEEI